MLYSSSPNEYKVTVLYGLGFACGIYEFCTFVAFLLYIINSPLTCMKLVRVRSEPSAVVTGVKILIIHP